MKFFISSKFGGKTYQWAQGNELLIFLCQVPETSCNLRTELLQEKQKNYNSQSVLLQACIFPQIP